MDPAPPPRFRVLDGVVPVEEPEGPSVLAVTEVRRYGDGTYRYSVGAASPPEDGREGLYGEAQLRPTGTQVSLDSFGPPGPFTVREIVVVSDTHPDPEAAGEEAEVQAWTDDEYLVWIPARECMWCMATSDLRPTGKRLPPPDRGMTRHSTHVAPSGEVLGNSEYVIVEDIDDLF